MANYRAIKGYKVQSLASDPSPLAEGNIWYDTGSNVLQVAQAGAAAWASGGTLNTGRRSGGASATQTAALVMGGQIAPPTGVETDFTESYNGSTWTEVGDLNTARSQLFAGGTQTATLGGGGYIPSSPGTFPIETELWNGTAWTVDPATQNSGAAGQAYGGTSTDGISFGGSGPGANWSAGTETWNGTAWSDVNDMTTGRNQLSGCGGSSTTAIAMAGAEANPSPPPGSKVSALCETWNGTSWTEVNNVNTAKWARSAFGIATAAMVAGGYPLSAASESWDGTSWTNTPSMGSTAYVMSQNTGTQALGLVAGGLLTASGARSTTTEEWSESPIAAKTVTTS